MENYKSKHKLHRHLGYERRLNLSMDKCIVDVQFSSMFRGETERIEGDGSHIVVSCKEFEDVFFFFNFQHLMNDLMQCREAGTNAEPEVNSLYTPAVENNSLFFAGRSRQVGHLLCLNNWRTFAASTFLAELRRGPGIDALVGIRDGEFDFFITKRLKEDEVDELRKMGCQIIENWERGMVYRDKRFLSHSCYGVINAMENCKIKLNKKLPVPVELKPNEWGESDDFITSLLMMYQPEVFRRAYMGDFRESLNQAEIDKNNNEKESIINTN